MAFKTTENEALISMYFQVHNTNEFRQKLMPVHDWFFKTLEAMRNRSGSHYGWLIKELTL